MQEEQQTYTISELASTAGVTTRTIRYYTAGGLLPAPDTRGRYARYNKTHLIRLQAIQAMKEAYLPLHIIRERLEQMTEPEFETLLKTPPNNAPVPSSQIEPSTTDTTPRKKVALLVSPRLSPDWKPNRAETTEEADISQISSEEWRRIVLAPGVELHVRQPQTPEACESLEHLIADAKHLLREKARKEIT